MTDNTISASVSAAAAAPAAAAVAPAAAVTAAAGAVPSRDGTVFLPSERFAVAPMVDVTDSIFRRMARIMTRRAMLYTEMIAADALVHGKLHLIDFYDEELPCTLQLGGSEPGKLAQAAAAGVRHGYSALNLNAGCPSDKVQSGNFGAVLMKTPRLIAECFSAMQEAAYAHASVGTVVPVSVKTRIGVDELDSEEFTFELMGTIYEAGCRHIIIHARKAWLNGLSPKENRTVPPLDYERVYKIKAAFPELKVTINGGILTIDQCQEQLKKVDGVMLGRAVIDTPYILASVDREIFGDTTAHGHSREEIIEQMVKLGAEIKQSGKGVHLLYRHLLGLYNGCPNSRLYRRYLSENMTGRDAQPEVLLHAVKAMERGYL